MKKITHGLLLMSAVLSVSIAYVGCTKDSTVTEYVGTPPTQPAFQLDSVPEPPLVKSKFVVLTHSRYLFYNLAKEIAAYHHAALIFIDDNSFGQITEKLKFVQPEYAIVVLPPFLITPDLVGNLFKCFCSLNDDIYPDVRFGYITGYTVDDARDLFYRDQQDTARLDKFLGVSHIYPGGDWVKPYLADYASDFRQDGWEGDTAIVNENITPSNVSSEVRKFSTRQLIFFIGHGNDDYCCGVTSSDIANSDLIGDVIFSGACYTGATCSEGPPGDFIALRILKQGACAYAASVITSGWVNLVFPAARVSAGNTDWGEAVRTGIISEMEYYNVDSLNIDSNAEINSEFPGGNYPAIDGIARIIPFGDPSFAPRLLSPVSISVP